MASRVNTKFVIILAVALALLFAGVAGMLVLVRSRSGAQYVARGDKAMAAGDYVKAHRFYSIAVHKEQQNVVWLKKWREAMKKTVPPTQREYFEDFTMWVGLHRQLALAQPDSVEAHREYLDIILATAELGGADRRSWDNLVYEAENALAYFDGGGGDALRRYRGLARMRLLGSGSEVETRDAEEARKDLEAALAANPGDAPCAGAMATWHRRQALEARARSDAQAEKSHLEAGRTVLERAFAANPKDPTAITSLLRYRIDLALNDLDPSRGQPDLVKARRERLEAMKPVLADAFEAMKNAEAREIEFTRAAEFHIAATTIDAAGGERLTSELVERVVSMRPDAADLIYLQGRLLQARGENEQAIARLQRILDLPVPPVSMEGIRLYEFQKQALFLQANSAISLASAAQPGPDREAALKRAAGFRDLLNQRVPEGSPELLFIDAKQDIARDNPRAGAEKLAEYCRMTGNKTLEAFEALAIRAQVASRLDGQMGLAADLYTQALELRPEAVPVRMALGEVQARLQRYEEALQTYEDVLDQDPDNAEARERVAVIAELIDAPAGAAASAGGGVADKVTKVLIEAERLVRGGQNRPPNPEGADGVLERGLKENNTDPRLVLALISLKLNAGDEAGARATLERGLAAHPEHAQLTGLKRQFEASTSLEAALRVIGELDAPELEKQIARYQVNRQYGKRAEADQILAGLAQQAPDDARVIEAQFIQALERSEFEAATRLAERAKALDLDGADGLTFLGRIQIARGDLSGAVQTLRQAITSGPESVPTLRMLGQILQSQGRNTEAVDAYRAALRLTPDDRATIKALVVALARAQQPAEALQVARDSEQFARNDPEFLGMLYDLEAAAGDRRAALEGRERLAARSPTNTQNGAALAVLYIEDRQWEKARRLLAGLRAAEDSLPLVAIDARWHADQGDLATASQVYVDYLDKLAREQSVPPGPQPFLAFGEFLIQRGDPVKGIAAMEEAAKFQTEKREADLYRADRLVSLGRFGDAEPIYRAALEAGVADPELQILARSAECLFQQNRLDEAEQRIASAGPAANENVALIVLRAAIAEGRGDPRRARDLLNSAVERFPNQHLPYYRRALLTASDRQFQNDALADLDRCIALRPDFWQALVGRAEINFARGRDEEGFRDLRGAVQANPGVDDLRFTLVIQLLKRGREQEAFDAARAGAKLRPNDAALGTRLANIFAVAGLWNRAAQISKVVWETHRDGQSAAGYVVALLRSTPPALAEADAVLGAPQIGVDRQPGLLTLRTMLRAKQKQMVRAEADAAAAYELAVADPRQLGSWYDGMREAWPDAADRLRLLDKLGPREQNAGWFHLIRAQTLGENPARRGEAITVLEKTASETTDPVLGTEIYRALDSLYRLQGDIPKALEAAKKGLAVNDRDVILNNNAASYLSENLGRPDEALPFALRAHELAPGNITVIDTLAGVHRRRKDWAKAEEVLTLGLRVAQTPADKAGLQLGLIDILSQANDPTRAQEALRELRRHLDANPSALNDEQKKTLESLEQRIR